MKIEPLPSLRDCFVDMNDVYTETNLQQGPGSELCGSRQKLSSILEKLSDKCLLIPDGLDVHGLGQNVDVVKIFSGDKLLDCGIVVFS